MKDYRIAVGRVFLLATLLAPFPAPVASQGDSTTVQVVRVIDGDTDSSAPKKSTHSDFAYRTLQTSP